MAHSGDGRPFGARSRASWSGTSGSGTTAEPRQQRHNRLWNPHDAAPRTRRLDTSSSERRHGHALAADRVDPADRRSRVERGGDGRRSVLPVHRAELLVAAPDEEQRTARARRGDQRIDALPRVHPVDLGDPQDDPVERRVANVRFRPSLRPAVGPAVLVDRTCADVDEPLDVSSRRSVDEIARACIVHGVVVRRATRVRHAGEMHDGGHVLEWRRAPHRTRGRPPRPRRPPPPYDGRARELGNGCAAAPPRAGRDCPTRP